jgi:YfiH family protein
MSELRDRIEAAALDWIVPDWPVPPNVRALVTTRNGGVATGERASFDLGAAQGNDDAVIENRRRLGAFLPAAPHWLRQEHGTRVVRLFADSDPGHVATGDAAVTAAPRVVCAVRMADCLPVLLADRRGRAAGVAHAGWRGLSAGVVETTVAALRALGVDDLVAWLGPAIGPASFEVGPEVRAAFCLRDPAAAQWFAPGVPGKWLADLCGLASMRLRAAGVDAVSGGGWCTRTDDARFFSYRRSRDTGRMAALVWLA